MSNAKQTGIESLQQVLKEFESTLHEEKAALAAFDYTAIDASAQRKLELQSRLEFQLHANRDTLQDLQADKIQMLKEALTQCRTLAKYNDALILAYQSHIKRLQERLTGNNKVGYGPKRRFMAAPSSSQAVLTDSVG